MKLGAGSCYYAAKDNHVEVRLRMHSELEDRSDRRSSHNNPDNHCTKSVDCLAYNCLDGAESVDDLANNYLDGRKPPCTHNKYTYLSAPPVVFLSLLQLFLALSLVGLWVLGQAGHPFTLALEEMTRNVGISRFHPCSIRGISTIHRNSYLPWCSFRCFFFFFLRAPCLVRRNDTASCCRSCCQNKIENHLLFQS